MKVKTTSLLAHYAGKKITVVIDAGHGGSDNGVIVNNIAEKEITLAIAKKIKELNTNENINIVLSREEDKSITPTERIDFTKKFMPIFLFPYTLMLKLINILIAEFQY